MSDFIPLFAGYADDLPEYFAQLEKMGYKTMGDLIKSADIKQQHQDEAEVGCI